VPAMTDPTTTTRERADLLAQLASARHFLRHTMRDLDDEQATRRTTASALCLAGILKHVTAVEQRWVSFIEEGPSSMDESDMAAAFEAHSRTFRIEEGETLAGLLEAYEEVASRTDALVVSLPDLDADHPLPPRPWFEAGARWSARRVLLHIVAESAQHAGHADIIRESLDGARSMG
jgi:uncharacterized damage-inducible protein DinB